MNISDRIQAFELALYVTGKADLLMFLKHLGFNDFPITTLVKIIQFGQKSAGRF